MHVSGAATARTWPPTDSTCQSNLAPAAAEFGIRRQGPRLAVPVRLRGSGRSCGNGQGHEKKAKNDASGMGEGRAAAGGGGGCARRIDGERADDSETVAARESRARLHAENGGRSRA